MQNFDRKSFGVFTPEGTKNVLRTHFGHTQVPSPAAGSDSTIHTDISSRTTAQTVTTGITQPDAPRCLYVQPGGTVADIGNGIVTVTGTNVEDMPMTESFQLTDGDKSAIAGVRAFKTVTSIGIPACDGTGALFSVGTRDVFGLYHRLMNADNAKVWYWTTEGTNTEDSSPTFNADAKYIEECTVDFTVAPNGSRHFEVFYVVLHWVDPDEGVDTGSGDDSFWSTTTSTSTSTTSSSTSSSSSSTSSSSSSTSSSSTSTTSSSSSTA